MGSRKTGESDDANQSSLIGDDLLMEILSRIPTPVVVIRCKSVCKSWCSLISSPYFIRRFKQQHINHPKPLSGMLANTVRTVSMGNPDDDEFNFSGFNLDYLPKNVEVLASCNDLILCRSPGNYYLCNPFTMQWAALPYPEAQGYIRTGLVCEPGGVRYRIVRFYTYREDRRPVVEMYCSETGEWIQCDDLNTDYLWFESKIAAYNGKLYWVNKGGEYLITYDPFNMTQTSLRLMDGPNSDDLWQCHRCHVGECEGVLRVMRFELRALGPGDQSHKMFAGISVWELQEEEVTFKEHIVFNEDIRRSFITDMEVAGFHLSNKDVMFLRGRYSLASFNTKTRELKVETKFFIPHNPNSYPYGYNFTLQLPWWPTLIPSPSPVL